MQVLTIGIAGGSGSGKSTVARKIIERVGPDRISHIEMDSYYRDLSHLSLEERAETNFDHPSSIDTELFLEHIKTLKSGNNTDRPNYSFATHTREKETTLVKPQPVVVVEGILLFENKKIRDEIDIKIFIDTPSDYRFIRRLMRDIKERGRTADSVVEQYYATVRPMHETFVAPTREYADIIIPWQGYNEVAIDMVISKIEHCLKERNI